MLARLLGAALTATLALWAFQPALALPLGAQAGGGAAVILAQAPDTSAPAPRRSRRKREGAEKKEMTASQMAASERRKKCGAEWREAKAGGKTGGLKWPK